MSRIMAFIKNNMAIVVLCAVMLVALPSALVASSMLNNRLRAAREKDVNAAYGELERAKVAYKIPATEPGGKPIELTTEPNAELTKAFREAREAINSQIKEIADAAMKINREGHEVLVEGLFPEPTSEPIFKKLEMADKLIGKPGRPSVYDGLLATINAGKQADPSLVVQDLQDFSARELDKVKAERGSAELSEEEKASLAKRLAERRIGLYQQHARRVSVYADEDIFRDLRPPGPASGEKDTWQYFVWQWTYWLAQDLVRAVGEANTEGGTLLPVEQAPVKRIVSITLAPEDLPIYGESTPANEDWTPTDTLSQAPLDPVVSVTGRRTSKPNKLYDVRFATLTLILDSSRVQDVINAISRTNFMSVIGVNLSPVDVWKDLDEGYYYGPSHVVEAEFKIESVWLRSWTADLMPDKLRMPLGMDPRDPGAAADAAAPAPAPAPAAKGRRNQDDDDLGGGG